MKDKRFKTNTGFTLMEMMIVVVIIGILATMAGPSFTRWIPKMKLKSEAREKVNFLRQARSKAISDNSQYGVYFDSEANQLLFFKDTSNPELTRYDDGLDTLMSAPACNEGNVAFSNCTFTNGAVVFFANGSASTSGSIDVEDADLGESFTISIMASTGRIRLQ